LAKNSLVMLAVGKRTDAWTKILLTDMRKVLAPILVSHDLGTRLLPDVSKCLSQEFLNHMNHL
jgi:hypothetical protein